MKIDFSSFSKHVFNLHFSEDSKLEEYLNRKYTRSDLLTYFKYSNHKKLKSNDTLVKLVHNLYDEFYGDILKTIPLKGGLNELFEIAIYDISKKHLLEMIFSNQEILSDFKDYLLLNPIKILLNIKMFLRIVLDSVFKNCKTFNIALRTNSDSSLEGGSTYLSIRYGCSNKAMAEHIFIDAVSTVR